MYYATERLSAIATHSKLITTTQLPLSVMDGLYVQMSIQPSNITKNISFNNVSNVVVYINNTTRRSFLRAHQTKKAGYNIIWPKP